MRLLIKNANILLENGEFELNDIFIDYGEIVEIGKDLEEEFPETIDVEGNYLFPGLIDVSCKICDPGFEYKEDIVSVSKSAVKGGFTSITASPDTEPVIDDKTVVKYIETKSKKMSLVNIYQYGSMTKGLDGEHMAEIGEMAKEGIVAISDGGRSLEDANLLNNILKYSVMFDLPVITHCEDKKILGDGVINRGIISTETGLKGIPREAEEVIVARNIILAKYSGAKIHIANVSTAGSVELIRQAKKDGIKITCHTCPHYFTLSEESLRDYDTFFKVNPPLRTQKDIEAIIEGLFDGTIDIISSGHSPSTIEQKRTEFDKADYGISSLETAFLIAYNCLVLERNMNLNLFLDKFTKNPAEFLGLDSKGQIKVGYSADLFAFDANIKNVIDSSSFASKAKFSPYNGLEVSGKVVFTTVFGNIMYLQSF